MKNNKLKNGNLLKSIMLAFVIAMISATGTNANAKSDLKLWNFENWQKNIIFDVKKFGVKPEFQGGNEALFKYFENKIQVPDNEQIIYKDLSGRVFCTLNIDDNGNFLCADFSYETRKSRDGFFSGSFMSFGSKTSEKCGFAFIENQILALLKNMPSWKPAKFNRKNVASTIIFAIQYDIKESLPNIYMLDEKEITEEEYWASISKNGHLSYRKTIIKRNQLFEEKRVNIMYLSTPTE